MHYVHYKVTGKRFPVCEKEARKHAVIQQNMWDGWVPFSIVVPRRGGIKLASRRIRMWKYLRPPLVHYLELKLLYYNRFLSLIKP